MPATATDHRAMWDNEITAAAARWDSGMGIDPLPLPRSSPPLEGGWVGSFYGSCICPKKIAPIDMSNIRIRSPTNQQGLL